MRITAIYEHGDTVRKATNIKLWDLKQADDFAVCDGMMHNKCKRSLYECLAESSWSGMEGCKGKFDNSLCEPSKKWCRRIEYMDRIVYIWDSSGWTPINCKDIQSRYSDE